jgi:hypothetical protein
VTNIFHSGLKVMFSDGMVKLVEALFALASITEPRDTTQWSKL